MPCLWELCNLTLWWGMTSFANFSKPITQYKSWLIALLESEVSLTWARFRKTLPCLCFTYLVVVVVVVCYFDHLLLGLRAKDKGWRLKYGLMASTETWYQPTLHIAASLTSSLGQGPEPYAHKTWGQPWLGLSTCPWGQRHCASGSSPPSVPEQTQ